MKRTNLQIEVAEKFIATLQAFVRGERVIDGVTYKDIDILTWILPKVVEPPPTITEHGRTYDLRPLPEPRKAREWWVHEEGGYLIQIDPSSPRKKFKVREVLEDENGK